MQIDNERPDLKEDAMRGKKKGKEMKRPGKQAIATHKGRRAGHSKGAHKA
jgi:hypothetical protein